MLSDIDSEIRRLLRLQEQRGELRCRAVVLREFWHDGRIVDRGETLMLPIAAAVSAAKLELAQLVSE